MRTTMELQAAEALMLLQHAFYITENTGSSQEGQQLVSAGDPTTKNDKASKQNSDDEVISDISLNVKKMDIFKSSTENIFRLCKTKGVKNWVPIGSGNTLIHKDKYKKIKWKSYTKATRSLLLAAFPRRTLATHSLTGKRSPAFHNKPAKTRLDPKIVMDVVAEIKDRFNVEANLVRSIITLKCADECKMYKMRLKKKAFKKKASNKAQSEKENTRQKKASQRLRRKRIR